MTTNELIFKSISPDHPETPLKHHIQIPHIIDILSRKDRHHVMMSNCISEKINQSFLEGIALYLAENAVPKTLQAPAFLYLDLSGLATRSIAIEYIQHEFERLEKEAEKNNQSIILAINQIDSFVEKYLYKRLHHPRWHFIILSNASHTLSSYVHAFFSYLHFRMPSQTDMLAILHTYRESIEQYHQVIIPEDMINYAWSLASRYLGGHCMIDNALMLLDSASAKCSAHPISEETTEERPLLTSTLLSHVVSNWTHIPSSYLHHNKFKALQFMRGMEQRLFGQEAALREIGAHLQQSCMKLDDKEGAFANFIFVGTRGTGKKACAFAMADQLFGSRDAIFHTHFKPAQHIHSLSDIQLTHAGSGRTLSLLEAILEAPYGIFLLDNLIDHAPNAMPFLKSIFLNGVLKNQDGQVYDFRHAIIIATTSLGSDKIQWAPSSSTAYTASQSADLMKLVLNEPIEEPDPTLHLHHRDEMHQQLYHALSDHLHPDILYHFKIIPFMPLNIQALEKIVRIQLNNVSKRLQHHFGIECYFAPEVIIFLADKTLQGKENGKSVRHIIEEHIHTLIAHQLFSTLEDKQRSKRLVIQLNDTGTLLCCEWATTSHQREFTKEVFVTFS